MVAYLWWPRRSSGPAAVHVQTQQVSPRTHPGLVPEPAADVVVPPLDESDPLVRQLVSALSSHPTVTAWLTTDHLVRNIAIVVMDVSEGRTPSKNLKVVKPAGVFKTAMDRTTEYIDPASYARYDGFGDAVAALDARGTARLYATLKPRLSEAYRELGDPEGDIDGAVTRAIVELLRTPAVDGRVALARKSVNYTYADPALESLSGAQRQFLRMGPRNVRLIQQKLREIAPYLGIDLARQGV
jgi:hypothetical protein